MILLIVCLLCSDAALASMQKVNVSFANRICDFPMSRMFVVFRHGQFGDLCELKACNCSDSKSQS